MQSAEKPRNKTVAGQAMSLGSLPLGMAAATAGEVFTLAHAYQRRPLSGQTPTLEV